MPRRIVSALVQYLITETNDAGDLVDELKAEPIRVFRAVHADVWAHGDALAFSKVPPTDGADPS